MAVISISFDTKTKAMTCTKDGEAVPHVVGASLGRRYGSEAKYACELVQWEENDSEDYSTMTRVVASALADPAWPNAALAGFKTAPKEPVQQGSDTPIDPTALAAELAAFYKPRA